MQEKDNKIKLIRWIVRTRNETYELNQREFEVLLEAERKNIRFVVFDDFVINTAYIESIEKKVTSKDGRFTTVSKKEQKFVV